MLQPIKILYVNLDDTKFLSLFIHRYINHPDRYAVTWINYTQNKQRHIKIKDVNFNNFSSIKEFEFWLNSDSFDFVYFTTIDSNIWRFIPIIPQKIKVIVWIWGYEIYSSTRHLKPLMYGTYSRCLYITTKYIKKRDSQILSKIKGLFTYPYYKNLLNSVLARIDYIKTPLPIEYEMLKQKHNLRAQPFDIHYCGLNTTKLVPFSQAQNVLINNSAQIRANHLDIIAALEHKRINRKLIIPISYGSDSNIIKKYTTKHYAHEKVFIEKFLPLDEYWELLNSCSHAIFGALRQHALGNIAHCLNTGVKIYFFKQSLMYEYFIEAGYRVFNIEDDLSQASLEAPLNAEDAEHNYRLFNTFESEADFEDILYREYQEALVCK